MKTAKMLQLCQVINVHLFYKLSLGYVGENERRRYH